MAEMSHRRAIKKSEEKAERARGVAGARATLTRYAENTARDGARIYGIWDGGVLVGGVMFVEFNAAAGTCELGCWLEPAAEGRGLLTRA
jgi:RimJ/RimL family protein N-acetyltransferase